MPPADEPIVATRPALSVPDRDNEAASVLASVDARPEDAARALRGLMAGDRVRDGRAQ